MKTNRLRLIVDNPPSGPSESFLRLTRNPDLPQPVRFEPTPKGALDGVI